MKQSLTRKLDPRGFTLVEVIVTIIATAIVAVIFINFMGTAMSRSERSVGNVHGEARAEDVMEHVIADYVLEINTNPSDALTHMLAKSYGTDVTVSMNYISFDSSGNEKPETLSNTLKVKVTDKESGRSLTTLLTKSRGSNSPLAAF